MTSRKLTPPLVKVVSDPWDAPDTPAGSLEEATERFLTAARGVHATANEKRQAGNLDAHARFLYAMALLTIDYGFQMITGTHLPADLRTLPEDR